MPYKLNRLRDGKLEEAYGGYFFSACITLVLSGSYHLQKGRNPMAGQPWEDWIPGVLSKRQVKDLCDKGYLSGFSNDSAAFDSSSVDLRISDEAYLLPHGSVKPAGGRYLQTLINQKLATRLELSDGYFVLKSRTTYLFKLRERLASLGELQEGDFYGQATAKSSIGRLDVLARLIVDGADVYEGFIPSFLEQSTSELFLEVTPMTFPIKARPDTSLSQLRFFLGSPDTVEIRGKTISGVLLHGDKVVDGTLSVDLTNRKIGGKDAVAFRTLRGPFEVPIDISSDGPKPNPVDYWEVIPADHNKRLNILHSDGRFYIIGSYERLTVPKGIAVYCRAIDETLGEMRIHYAGFVHPFFGLERTDRSKGTPLIFEVRGHDLNVSLVHREKMAKLICYRMSEDAIEEEAQDSPYKDQTLKLSKFFAAWPEAASGPKMG